MVKNSELFRKLMMFPKVVSMAAFKAGGPEGPGGEKGGFPPCHGPGPGFHGGPHMPPPFPFGGGDRPPMPPHGFGKGPGGPMGHMVNRERMLAIISEYPGGIRQKELAEKAGINASTTSELVSKLEDDGYLVRTIDENDRRATVLKLTEMGAVRAEEISSEREAFMEVYFSKLTEEEKQTLSDLLDKLIG